jgi:hypothetical protein
MIDCRVLPSKDSDHVDIARPPLYKVKKSKTELYLENEGALDPVSDVIASSGTVGGGNGEANERFDKRLRQIAGAAAGPHQASPLYYFSYVGSA